MTLVQLGTVAEFQAGLVLAWNRSGVPSQFCLEAVVVFQVSFVL